ncbi:histidine kinase dimerization/phospho-acceptor domain-containing protein, partial [Arcobacter sp.]|uniref:histidine kinase dimerization/phospho-acceptor domain-containing protein n=1 Tax=Arcobacter sp. TaxID=1872629 RepID=UPI003D0E157A
KSNNSYEAQAIKKDGTKIPVLLKVNKISFDNQESTIISIIDLSDVKNKEDLILQQSKMASLGEMIGNIAHQWRQPLSSISTAASGMKLLKEYGKLDDEHFKNGLDSITETSQFLSQTIDDFRNYIKDNKQKKEFNLSSSIKKVVSIMQGSFTNHFIKVKINVKDLTIN